MQKKTFENNKENDNIVRLQEKNKSLSDELIIFKKIFSLMPNHVYWKNKEGIYQGCNDAQAKSLGLNSAEEVIGKTDRELPWKDGGDYFRKIDEHVMQTGEIISTEEESVLPDGKDVIYYSTKRPLYDIETNDIIGVIGVSVDITAQKEAQKLKLEDEINKNIIEQQEAIKKSLYKFVHDIQSPITSIMSMANTFELPESERIALRNTARRAGDLCHHLLMQYNKKNEDFSVAEESEVILVSCTLAEILTEKRYEYREKLISFEDAFKEHFVFIQVEPGAFKRMISNIINNGIGAFDNKEGTIVVGLEATIEWVKITVKDSGKGMTPEAIEKVMNNAGFTEGKQDGHGIGYSQIHQTLKDNYGKINISSIVGQGTCVTLTFPREQAPFWSADAIHFKKQDIVVILDDEASVTAAWQSRFETALKHTAEDIQIKYFNEGQEALAFLNSLSSADKSKVFLITDYELLHQNLNGLDVIEQSNIARSILATSHYADKVIRARAVKLGTKILPKPLIPEISISILKNVDEVKKVDLVFVDDDEVFAKTMIRTAFRKLHVDYYASSNHFLTQSLKYPKDIKICLDKNFEGGDIDGLTLARKLHEQGFSRIFLVSGEPLKQNKLPEYITVVHKSEIEKIRDFT